MAGFWTGKKRENISGEKSFYWKGDDVGYHGIHKWIAKKLGKPNFCENCKTTIKKHYHWANISGKYIRDVSDWKRLCVKCHRSFDSSAVLRGEKNGMAKLNDATVIEIRKLNETGLYSSRKLASMFSVSKTNILDVIHKRIWKHTH